MQHVQNAYLYFNKSKNGIILSQGEKNKSLPEKSSAVIHDAEHIMYQKKKKSV